VTLYNAAEFAAAFELWFLPGCDLRMLFDASHNTCEMQLSIESAGNSSFIARARPGPLALVMRVFQDLYVRLVSPCLRDDCDGSALRLLAWQSRDPDPTRRLLALAEIYDGVPRSEAARAGGAGVQIVRDLLAALQRQGGRTLILSAEDDVDESQTRHRAARAT
jgi:hypothetical protein